MSQNTEDARSRADPEGQARNTTSRKKDKPPRWLSGSELLQWEKFTDWCSAFQREKAHIGKTSLFYTLRSNGVAIGISLITATLTWKITPGPYFTSSALISIASISCATAASVIAIILAFVVFLIGRAGSLEDQARSNIRHEIHRLESVRVEIAKFVHAKVPETDPSIKTKLKDLVDASKKFDAAIFELIRLFSIATKGTFYDIVELELRDKHILAQGGKWFVAHTVISLGSNEIDFGRRILGDAISASSNIYRLNNDIKSAENQHQKALEVSLVLPSLFIIVVLALIALLTANTIVFSGGSSGFWIILLSITLILLLATQIFLLMRWLRQLVCKEMIIRVANREFDQKVSAKNTRVDREEMLRDWVQFYTKASQKIDEPN